MSRLELARLPSVLTPRVASLPLSLSLLVFNDVFKLGFEPVLMLPVLEMSKVELARWPSVRLTAPPSLTFELSRLEFKTSSFEMSVIRLLTSNIFAFRGIFGSIRPFRPDVWSTLVGSAAAVPWLNTVAPLSALCVSAECVRLCLETSPIELSLLSIDVS